MMLGRGSGILNFLHVKWNRAGLDSPTFPGLKHDSPSTGTPGAEACDAVDGAFRPEWREAIILLNWVTVRGIFLVFPGHFAPAEEPAAVAGDLTAFFRGLG